MEWLQPTSGDVLLNGQRINGKKPFEINRMGLSRSFQITNIFPKLSVFENLRCGVLFAHGEHFTGGLDLADVLPRLSDGELNWAEGELNPAATSGPERLTPVVAAAQGWCMTIGIELLLAADVRIAASDTRFAQIEIG